MKKILLTSSAMVFTLGLMAQSVLLSENFETGSLDSSIRVQTFGSFNSYPGIKNATQFGSKKAFGFGLSTCAASCFFNYTSHIIINFPPNTFVDSIEFGVMEIYGNWGSNGEVRIDGNYLQNSQLGKAPSNDHTAEGNPRKYSLKVQKAIDSIDFYVYDITNASEIFIDDLIIYGYSGSGLSIDFLTEDVCLGDSTILIDNSTAQNDTITSWLWKFGDGNISTQQHPHHLYGNAGIYEVTLVVTTSQSNIDSVSKMVEVFPLPQSVFSAADVCFKDSINFINSSSIASGTITSYKWYFGDGDSSTIPSPKHLYTSAKSHVVELVAISDQICADTISRQVQVFENPVADFSSGKGCLGNPLMFADKSTIGKGSISSYMWDFGDGQSSTDKSPSHIYNASGSFAVKLLVTSNANCSDSIIKVVDNHVKPPKPTISQNGSQLTSTAAFAYQWYRDGVEIINATSQTYSYGQDGSFTVLITDSNGCSAESDPFIITGIAIGVSLSGFEVFPNPFSEQFTVEMSLNQPQGVTILLYDLNGQLVDKLLERELGSGTTQFTFSTSSLPAGIYALTLNTKSDGLVKKLVKF